MRTVLKNGYVYTSKGFVKKDIVISDGLIFDFDNYNISEKFEKTIDINNKYVAPGFVDVHVHFREPGFLYKETIATGTAAAARGGYSLVCSMPNLIPPPSTVEGLNVQLEAIKKDAKVKVIPYGSITRGQNGKPPLSDMIDISNYVFAFTDDGKGVQDNEVMRQAMIQAATCNKPIVAHCEEESLLKDGYIHDGAYAQKFAHKGISSESEWMQVKRDIEISEETGCQYHVCHVSTKETVSLVREAKKRGVRVSCEVTPHHLLLCDEDLKEEGKYKMNPPLRSMEDKNELIRGIVDGTIDIIATDHAPHSAEEKSRGLEGSAMGIVGLECAFSLLYTELVQKGIIKLDKLIELMAINPRKVFKLDRHLHCRSQHVDFETIENGVVADIVILDLGKKHMVDSNTFFSMGKSTPFDGKNVQGDIYATIVNGEFVYISE